MPGAGPWWGPAAGLTRQVPALRAPVLPAGRRTLVERSGRRGRPAAVWAFRQAFSRAQGLSGTAPGSACSLRRYESLRQQGCWGVWRAWLTNAFEPLPAPAAGSCGGCGAGWSWWIAGMSSPRRLTCCWLPPPPPHSAGARAAGGPEDLCHQSEASPPSHHQMSIGTSRLTSPTASAAPPTRPQQPRGGRGARDLPPQALVAVLGGVSRSHRITHASRHRRRRRPPGAPWQARAGGAAPARLGLAAPRQGPP